jgi:hypothetical protein
MPYRFLPDTFQLNNPLSSYHPKLKTTAKNTTIFRMLEIGKWYIGLVQYFLKISVTVEALNT